MFFPFLDFLFPLGTRQEHMKVCETQEVKLFCKDYVEKAEVMFILATAATLLIILSLVSIYIQYFFSLGIIYINND